MIRRTLRTTTASVLTESFGWPVIAGVPASVSIADLPRGWVATSIDRLEPSIDHSYWRGSLTLSIVALVRPTMPESAPVPGAIGYLDALSVAIADTADVVDDAIHAALTGSTDWAEALDRSLIESWQVAWDIDRVEDQHLVIRVTTTIRMGFERVAAEPASVDAVGLFAAVRVIGDGSDIDLTILSDWGTT